MPTQEKVKRKESVQKGRKRKRKEGEFPYRITYRIRKLRDREKFV